MAYSEEIANLVRNYLAEIPKLKIIEKKMFGGLAFLVDEKMCVNVSGENLMCRFDPKREEEVASKTGFLPMIMRGKQLSGYCYVEPEGFKQKSDFEYWMKLCLEFNSKAISSKSIEKK